MGITHGNRGTAEGRRVAMRAGEGERYRLNSAMDRFSTAAAV